MKKLVALIALALLFAPVALGQARVPVADETRNRLTNQVIGNKEDTAATAAANTGTLVAYAKGALSLAGTTTDTTTDSVHGKIGTDTEMANNSLWDILVPAESTGITDVDISAFDYPNDYVAILTITPAAGQCLLDVAIDLDWNKTTTGWDTIATAGDTLDVCVTGKIDGTNQRGLLNGTQVTANGNGTLENNEDGERLAIGMVGVNETVVVRVKIDNERDDCEIPYRVTYRGATPTITPVAAG